MYKLRTGDCTLYYDVDDDGDDEDGGNDGDGGNKKLYWWLDDDDDNDNCQDDCGGRHDTGTCHDDDDDDSTINRLLYLLQPPPRQEDRDTGSPRLEGKILELETKTPTPPPPAVSPPNKQFSDEDIRHLAIGLADEYFNIKDLKVSVNGWVASHHVIQNLRYRPNKRS